MHVLAELLPVRDPGSQRAAHLPQCVLGPEARPPGQRHQGDGNGPRGSGGLDALVLELLDRAHQLVWDPKDAPQHADEHTRSGGHRHPPEAPVQPARVLRKREPEIRAALDQPQKRQGREGQHDPEQRRVAHDHPEPGRFRQGHEICVGGRCLAPSGLWLLVHDQAIRGRSTVVGQAIGIAPVPCRPRQTNNARIWVNQVCDDHRRPSPPPLGGDREKPHGAQRARPASPRPACAFHARVLVGPQSRSRRRRRVASGRGSSRTASGPRMKSAFCAASTI